MERLVSRGKARRIMSARHRTQLFREFERWAWNEKGYGPRTRETYYIKARAANAWLEDNRNVSICWAGYKDLQAFLWTRSTNANNRNVWRQALIAFGEFLIFAGYTDSNPARSLPRLKVPRRLPKSLDREAVGRVLAVAGTLGAQTHAAITLLLYTGIRRAELLNLEWRFFEPDLKAGDCWLRFIAKGNKERTLPVSDLAGGELVKTLMAWKRECPDAQWVFPSEDVRRQGQPISVSTLQKWIKQVEEASGVYLHPHRLRHTCAQMMVDAGVPITDVAEWLGHEKISTTQGYMKVRASSLREAARKMSIEALKNQDPEDESKEARLRALLSEETA